MRFIWNWSCMVRYILQRLMAGSRVLRLDSFALHSRSFPTCLDISKLFQQRCPMSEVNDSNTLKSSLRRSSTHLRYRLSASRNSRIKSSSSRKSASDASTSLPVKKGDTRSSFARAFYNNTVGCSCMHWMCSETT